MYTYNKIYGSWWFYATSAADIASFWLLCRPNTLSASYDLTIWLSEFRIRGPLNINAEGKYTRGEIQDTYVSDTFEVPGAWLGEDAKAS